jgi:V8-like Glu-specific endopeptidase
MERLMGLRIRPRGTRRSSTSHHGTKLPDEIRQPELQQPVTGRRRFRRVVATAGGSLLGAVALTALSVPARGPATDVIRRIDESFTPVTTNSPSGQAFKGVATVGALFPAGTVIGSAGGGQGTGHFCTATVVQSPGADLAVTAAHCLGGQSTGIVFVPGYHDGQAPYGSWVVAQVFTDAEWQSLSDPDDDVAFLQLAPATDGTRVAEVTGAEQLNTSTSAPRLVQVIGYPEDTDEPVTCRNWTRTFSLTQLEFDCGGYPDGTSGGPFLADAESPSGTATIIGVIGGYEQGGDTDAVSYAAVFGPRVATLYQQAVAAG